ncbi:unnamed protein product [Hyaloperonospora brassicae]|uniref:RxLR effector candidate protein n=1 Tax=Hyaloperonospora brassicae TaxID=162125 RepID=A0AAV0UPR0_HYABA|nr:unnamed protein product [Hyaloperonospora brassicae]
MNSCTLRPPNDRDLSDDVIGNVMEGRKSNRHFVTHDVMAVQDWRRPSHRTFCQPPPPTLYASQATRTKYTDSSPRVPERDAAAAIGLLLLMNETKRHEVPSPRAHSW